jgi:hypothetical protein
MHSSFFKFTLALDPTLLFWKLLFLGFLLDISEALLCSVSTLVEDCPSATCASPANDVFRDVGVVGKFFSS